VDSEIYAKEWGTGATPTHIHNGDARLLNTKPAKSTLGYMVIIGDQTRNDRHVFIDWAETGGLAELLARVQFSSPHHMAILGFFPATIADVEDHQAALMHFRCRTDATHWFKRTPQIDAYIQRLRDDMAAWYAEAETNEGATTCENAKPIRQTSTLLPKMPVKPKANRRKNKRTQKSRRRRVN
jgi:hypothetical protein